MAPTSPRRPRRVLRIILYTVGGIVLLGVAGIAVFVATFNPNSYKPQIIAAVQDATGRQLALNGPIHLTIGLQPTLEVTDVAFANPPGFSRPDMATLQKLDVQLKLIPLLSRRVEIDRLVMTQPDILLETNAKGQSNWQFGAAAPPTPAPPPPPAPPVGTQTAATAAPPRLLLSSLSIVNGTLAMRDPSGKITTLALKTLDAKSSSPTAPMHVTMDATYNGAPVTLTADTGPLSRLENEGDTTPYPLKLSLQVGNSTLAVDGTVAQPLAGHGVTLSLNGKVPDLAALGVFAGTTLPALKNLAVQAKVADSGNGGAYTVSDLTLGLAQGDLSGTASVTTGAHPEIKANLSSKQLDLDALMAALSGNPPPAAPGSTAPAPAPAATSRYLIPDTKLPFDALRPLNADVTLSVADLKYGSEDYKGLSVHAIDQQGQVTVDPFGVDVPGGHVAGTLKANAAATPPTVALTLQAPSIALATVLKALHKPGYASGNMQIRADLHGAGDSPHAIASTMDGAMGIAMANGQIDSQVLGGMMASFVQASQIANLANRAGMSTLNCFALRVDVAHGIGTVRALSLDASTVGMTGSGTMNFGNETLNLHLDPTVGVAGTDIAAPVIVSGTFSHPSTQADTMGLVTGNAGTVAKLALGASTGGLTLLAGSALENRMGGSSCAGPLALARFEQAPAAGTSGGTAPATNTAPAKPQSPLNNAAGVLKNLFR